MHPWAFRARFRRTAFGWKGTKPAIERMHQALVEIRAVARHDPATAAEGAVLVLEKLSPALSQIDSSSGALGNATYGVGREFFQALSWGVLWRLKTPLPGRISRTPPHRREAVARVPGFRR